MDTKTLTEIINKIELGIKQVEDLEIRLELLSMGTSDNSDKTKVSSLNEGDSK